MKHLSSTQICEWTLGEHNAEAARHLQECEGCREEIARLQNGLLSFKQSVHGVAERLDTQACTTFETPRASRLSWSWAAAGAMAMAFALLPLYLDVEQPRTDTQATDDAMVLIRVQSHLSRGVPQTMEHLNKLMINEGDSQ
jgi:hypothetical protein